MVKFRVKLRINFKNEKANPARAERKRKPVADINLDRLANTNLDRFASLRVKITRLANTSSDRFA